MPAVGRKFGEIEFPVERDEGDMDPDCQVVPLVHEQDPPGILGENAGQVREVAGLTHDKKGDGQGDDEDEGYPREVGIDEEEGGRDDQAGDENPFLPSFRGYLPLLPMDGMGPMRVERMTSRLSAGRTTWLCYGPGRR